MHIDGYPVKTFSPEWLLREKILSQYQRQGTQKEVTDIRDVMRLIPLAVPGTPELNFNHRGDMEAALENILQKRPNLRQTLKGKINCPAVFHNWYVLFRSR